MKNDQESRTLLSLLNTGDRGRNYGTSSLRWPSGGGYDLRLTRCVAFPINLKQLIYVRTYFSPSILDHIASLRDLFTSTSTSITTYKQQLVDQLSEVKRLVVEARRIITALTDARSQSQEDTAAKSMGAYSILAQVLLQVRNSQPRPMTSCHYSLTPVRPTRCLNCITDSASRRSCVTSACTARRAHLMPRGMSTSESPGKPVVTSDVVAIYDDLLPSWLFSYEGIFSA